MPRPDFVLVTGDAYVDHPSFGAAVIVRILERRGYRVAILAQPDWRSADAFRAIEAPRLGCLITAGNVDSMVNHYTVFKRKRRTDSYSPGGEAGHRPDRATIVYSNRAREAWPGVPLILGGIEASLRRLAHYDYWDDRIRRSVLLDAKADLLVYGMGENAVVEIAEALDSGIAASGITWIRGTCYKAPLAKARELALAADPGARVLPSFEELLASKEAYAESFRIQYRGNDAVTGVPLVEPYGDGLAVVVNPPMPPLSTQELDDVYALPFTGDPLPQYAEQGGVPAIEEVRFSLTANRGCFGGCAFCALAFHQGREVRGRSKESVVREAEALIRRPDFKGYIHDVGGPTANFHAPACERQIRKGVCRDKDCLWPEPCRQLTVDHKAYLDLLRTLRRLTGVKKVFIRSGIRYDYVMADPDDEFLTELVEHHVSGTLKVAPEHVSPRVLAAMRKPKAEVFEAFRERYRAVNERLGKDQYLIPYLISSHPGATLQDAVELALYLHKTGFVPEQVQDFYPTPGTLATCMYYTGKDPLTGQEVYVARDMGEKRMQRALLAFNKRENQALVREALTLAGRQDLIPVLAPGGKETRHGTGRRTGRHR